MRIFLFILAFVCLPFVCHAQAKDKGFFMEMNIGYAHTDYHDDSYMLLSPRIGYQFNDRWAAGVKYIGETDNYLQYHTLGDMLNSVSGRITVGGLLQKVELPLEC
ncbi:hypothetical protein B5F34_01800 [Mediterranea sp. An20]|uniref:hypothetical protein n=1 Tax=Mediterranea sp. An20 TaxID=1965586 RepID=UPI000B36F13D|nr:hypothetical protein [Mediterranea sp. An20]OUP11758.1 hypothetical protein B5F34_01800 [Mediterranea sp. An20]